MIPVTCPVCRKPRQMVPIDGGCVCLNCGLIDWDEDAA